MRQTLAPWPRRVASFCKTRGPRSPRPRRWPAMVVPKVHAGRGQHDSGGAGRLRRPRHRRGRQRPVGQERPDQARRHGRRVSQEAATTLQRAQARSTATRSTCPTTASSSASTPTRRRWTACSPGDVAILATPPAFRWVHFTYAIEKGLNVFMEKPVTVDGPTSRKMLALAEESAKKNLKVGVGLMCRHCEAPAGAVQPDQGRRDRRHHHAAGLPHARPGGHAFSTPKPDGDNELLYQIQQLPQLPVGQRRLLQRLPDPQHRRVLLDEGRLAGRRPRRLGGRHYRGDNVDQNFDTYSVEYTFADGTKLFLDGRTMRRLPRRVRQLRPRHQGLGDRSRSRRTRPAKCRIFKGQNIRDRGGNVAWAFPAPEPNPYQLEWDDLIDAIRKDKPYNEVKRGAEASLVTSMGRMAAPHRPGHHLRRDAQLRARVRPGRRQARPQRPRAAHRQRRRQLPRAAAGHRDQARVRLRPVFGRPGQIRILRPTSETPRIHSLGVLRYQEVRALVRAAAAICEGKAMQGEVVYLYAFDVANEIDTDRVQDILASKPLPFEIQTDHTFPKDVPLYRPLVIEPARRRPRLAGRPVRVRGTRLRSGRGLDRDPRGVRGRAASPS